MDRLRASLALALMLGMAGCAGADRRLSARPGRPWAQPVAFGSTSGRRTPPVVEPRAGRPDLLAAAGRPVGGVGRYFPGLANRGAEFVMPDRPAREPIAARSAASRGGDPAEELTVADPLRPSLAGRRAIPTLPVALNAETHPDPEPTPTRRPPAIATASADRPGPRDEDARRVEAEAESSPEAVPPVAEADPGPSLAETGPVPDDDGEESDGVPPVVEPESGGARPEGEEVAEAPPPVAEAEAEAAHEGGSAGFRVERPADPDAFLPALAGRPRLPLVRPTGLPAGLPPPTFPPTYYGPDDRRSVAPRPRSSPADREPAATPPRRRWRLGLVDRLRTALMRADDASAGPEPGDVAKRR